MSAAVADQIRAERARKRWTVNTMAERSGLARSTYYKLETGDRVADVSQLGHICAAIGLSLSEFLMRVEVAMKDDEGHAS